MTRNTNLTNQPQLELLAGLKVATTLLSRREYYDLELVAKLQKRYRYSREFSEQIVEAAQQRGWQNNQRFFEDFLQHYQPKFGVMRIVRELYTRKVRPLDMEVMVEQVKEQEAQKAYELISALRSQGQKKSFDYVKSARFLAGRGFGSQSVTHALARIDYRQSQGDEMLINEED